MARRAVTNLKKRKKLKQITLFCQEKEKQPLIMHNQKSALGTFRFRRSLYRNN